MHGCSLAVAKTAVRCFLEDLIARKRSPENILVITGKGGAAAGRSTEGVLKQGVRDFLVESGGPRFTENPRGDEGCFLLLRHDVQDWLQEQPVLKPQDKKGYRTVIPNQQLASNTDST